MSRPGSISLVVCTRNRAAVLPRAFDALARLSCGADWEIVLVDNASTDDTPLLISTFARRLGGSCVSLREPRPGLGRARNTGWRAARGAIVCFTDDDCYPAADYLERMRDVFADPSVGFVGGRILLFDPTDLPTGTKTDEAPRIYPAGFVFGPGELHGANLALRASVLRAIQGFDERAGAGTPYPFEDDDVLMRASLAGYAGRYDPGPLVYHHHRRRDPRALRAVEGSYARGRGAYFAKFLSRPGHRLPLLKRWVGSLHANGLRWLPIELLSGMRYLRRGVPTPRIGARKRPV